VDLASEPPTGNVAACLTNALDLWERDRDACGQRRCADLLYAVYAMPANLSPEYKKAEQAFRAAHEARERLVCLKEMLRTIPKHKGTEHIQADIKSRMRQLTDELNTPHKGPTRSGTTHTVSREGAAQICLIGPPNSGKSSLHAILTGSKTEIGPFPYTTREPLPGMLPFEDIAFQLVDLPPISAERMEPWIAELLQSADAAWLVVDLADPACAEHLLSIRAQLVQRRIILNDHWPNLSVGAHSALPSYTKVFDALGADNVPDPFRVQLPTLLVANKSDLDTDPEEVQALEELTGARFPAIACSAKTGHGLDHFARFLFEALQIKRVYTKPPGQPPDRNRPFTVCRGGTVLDVARLVHQDVASRFKFARLWGSGAFDGQQVGPDHLVADGDVVELHAK
jgi:ribosome-interacting GTPase 1